MPVSDIKGGCPFKLDRIRCEQATREVTTYKEHVRDDPVWRRRYWKSTSKENLKIEDEAILAFLKHSGKKRGFLRRNGDFRVAEKMLNRLENVLSDVKEKKRGRPRIDTRKVDFRINYAFYTYLEDYANKKSHISAQEAIRAILREHLRDNGYPV